MLGRPRVFLVDEVVHELRERILRGDYPPGSRLQQERVAADLELSRTPVRVAMRTLEHEGLLVPAPSGGVCVAERNPSTLLAAYELREVIDGLAARLAASRSAAGVEADLTTSLAEQQGLLAGDWSPEAWTRCNTHFHGIIIDASQNSYLRGLLPFVQTTSQVFRPMSVLGRERAAEAHDEHSAIAAALLNGEVEQAETLARSHIRRTSDALARELTSQSAQHTPT